MSFHLPNILRKENQTLENFYRYGFLFFAFLYLYIVISIYSVYLPISKEYPGSLLTDRGLETIMWVSILLFLDAFVAGVMYKRHAFYGVWRYKNTVLGFYLLSTLVICSVFVLNYLFA